MTQQITDIIKILGQEKHSSIIQLSDEVFKKCQELDISKTIKHRPITKQIVLNQVRAILSNIRRGKGTWKSWSYRQGKDYLKLYDNMAIDIVMLKKETLQDFEYYDIPTLKIKIEPVKQGLETKHYFQNCETLKQAQELLNDETASGLYIFIGRMRIQLDNGS